MAFHDGNLPRKGRWYQAASEIGVTPEALLPRVGASEANCSSFRGSLSTFVSAIQLIVSATHVFRPT